MKRAFFTEIGGFTEDYQVGYEDYEFFALAVLKGYKLEVVAESLFWYRRAYNSMSFSTPLYKNRMRSLRPYLNNLPKGLSNLFLYIQSIHYENEGPFMGTNEGVNGLCDGFKTCNICLLAGCGWCQASRICMDGSMNSSVNGNCSATQGWIYGIQNANNCTACDSGMNSCDACEKIQGCGWCKDDLKGSQCLASSSNNSAYWLNSKCNGEKSPKLITRTNGSCSGRDRKSVV